MMSDRWFDALCFFNVGIFIYKKMKRRCVKRIGNPRYNPDPLTIIEENGCFMYRDLCE